jgi:N-acyl-D-amino-acid deacylase
LPLLAMRELRDAGIAGDEEVFAGAAEFTQKFFAARVDKLRDGRGIGGQAATVGYGLWTLDIAEAKPDDTTEAMVEFLLKTQRDDGRWAPPSHRPPLEESHFATTVLAAYYMPRLCGDGQRDEVEKSVARARHWLVSANRESQEDRVYALWGSVLLDDADDEAGAERQAHLRDDLLAAQRDDGGWSQRADMESDAYATGQTLYVLHEAGLPATSVFYQRGVEYLLAAQHDDGSWFVETRSRPVQVFFDNGDPHGKSQFISIAATSWAVTALAQSSATNTKMSDDPRTRPPTPPVPLTE